MRFLCLGCAVLLVSCGQAPRPTTPALTPETAAGLLRYDHKAENWLKYVQKHNRACEYRLDLPDQGTHPSEVDMGNIVFCGSAPAPREYQASVVFQYDQAAQRWVLTRFSS